MRVAFWNTGKNKINNHIASLIVDNGIDVIGLAEYKDSITELQSILLKEKVSMDHIDAAGCDRIEILGEQKIMKQGFQSSYCSVQIIRGKTILCCIHLRSDLFGGEGQRHLMMRDIIGEIEEIKQQTGINKVVLFGDFNENPFQEGCLEADKFHAVPCAFDAQKGKRRIPGTGREFHMYYNPMWNLMGDFSFPPGTYYHANSGETIEPFWHMLDQVIISRDTIDAFVKEKLKIVTKTSQGSLLNKNMQPNIKISDHLPIVFEVKEG